jgi:hypothetical protein
MKKDEKMMKMVTKAGAVVLTSTILGANYQANIEKVEKVHDTAVGFFTFGTAATSTGDATQSITIMAASPDLMNLQKDYPKPDEVLQRIEWKDNF